jgi:hypothetical protein
VMARSTAARWEAFTGLKANPQNNRMTRNNFFISQVFMFESIPLFME